MERKKIDLIMMIWARILTVVMILITFFPILGIILMVLIIGGGSIYDRSIEIWEILALIGMYGSVFLFGILLLLLRFFIFIPLFYYAWIKSKKYERFFKALAHVSYVLFILSFVINLFNYNFSDFNIFFFSLDHIFFFVCLPPVFYYAWRKESIIVNEVLNNINHKSDDNLIN